MGLDSFDSALAVRDVIKHLVDQEIQKARPGTRLGIVYSIASDHKTAKVVFPGDSFDSSAPTVKTPTVKPTKSYAADGSANADVVTVEKHPVLGLQVISVVKGNPIHQVGKIVTTTPDTTTQPPNTYIAADGTIQKSNYVAPTPQSSYYASWETSLSSQANITTTSSTSPGLALVNITASVACTAIVTVTFDAKQNSSNGDVLVGELEFDGINDTTQLIVAAPLSGFRATVTRGWRIDVTAGMHTFRMYARLVTPGSGSSWTLNALHTTMLVEYKA